MLKPNFAQCISQDRRLCILLALETVEGYCAPHPLLKSFLDSIGHRVSDETLLADLSWLAAPEQRLLTVEKQSLLMIATATQRGVDVAQGRAVVDGVKRPMPAGAAP
jgi:hypothetical protein